MSQKIASKCLNIVITGGNSGVGFQTMKELYFRGNNIVFGSRNEAKNQQAITEILNEQKTFNQKHNHFIKSFPLDLSKKQSVEKFVEEVKKTYQYVDILINNAGLILDNNHFSRNENNIEMTLAINHFGPFYLTYLLFGLLKNRPEARIINVSSIGHFYAPDPVIEDIECKNKKFSANQQYLISKFMNVLFTQQLMRKTSKYSNIKTVCLHPGIVDSNFGSDVCLVRFLNCLCCCFYINNAQGARTSIHLATEEFSKLRNGEYYNYNTQHKQMDKRARDPKLGEQLWEMSQKVYGIKFDP